MKKLFVIMIFLAAIFFFSSCSVNERNSQNSNTNNLHEDFSEYKPSSENESSSPNYIDEKIDNSETTKKTTTKTLVAYFSRTGENYGVGVIEKGNTHIIADIIAEKTNADIFEIRTLNAYPENYDECTDVAKKEQEESARPELAENLDSLDGYDTIFLGYPIWWGDMPMAVYTFIESHNFSGKTIVPFCTHAGSGMSGTVETLKIELDGATVLDGLALEGTIAQNSFNEAEQAINEYLNNI